MSDSIQLESLFEPVDPGDLPSRAGRRARTSAPILDAFVESGTFLVRLNPEAVAPDKTEEEAEKRMKTLYSSLKSYAVNNEYPVSVFQRGSVVHLQRLDIDEDGNEVAWTPAPKPVKVASNGDTVDEGADEEYE